MARNKSSKSIASELSKRTVVIATEPQMLETLNTLSQKVMSSKVLNGGFDTMIEKVEKIEAKVDSIHDAVYHPDDGLFARVKDIEHVKANAASIEKLNIDVNELQAWHHSEEKLVEKEAKLIEEHNQLVKNHSDQLKELVSFKSRVNAVAKWLALTVATGILAGVGKLIYDFIHGHVIIN
jgi:uncharacterized protein YaaN involved in tellurite resistance